MKYNEPNKKSISAMIARAEGFTYTLFAFLYFFAKIKKVVDDEEKTHPKTWQKSAQNVPFSTKH